MFQKNDTRSTKIVIVFNMAIRLGLGLLFGFIGYGTYPGSKEGAIVLFMMALVLFVTAFLRPKRCLGDSCHI
ncbi:hypothetical protein [Parasediminibacterium sp. JCM 36343]|uniref:hypothetical protein n=1 Tax=Parasediminibacterium sp. JCM 36343 TaxID=3374279 RepID=UPI00397A5B26